MRATGPTLSPLSVSPAMFDCPSVAPLRRSPPRSGGLRPAAWWWWLAVLFALTAAVRAAPATAVELAPSAVVASADGKTLYVALSAARSVVVYGEHGEPRTRIALPGPPSGLALSPDGSQLAVTCAAPVSVVCLIDAASAKVTARLPAGHTANSPVFSADGATLYVCNRFNHEVLVLDLKSGRAPVRIAVDREPVAAALSPDGKWLLIANHLPAMAADTGNTAAVVSIIDTGAHRVAKTLSLPNGGNLALGIAVSPDGRHAAVTHNLARYYVPTTQVERGWMNTAGLTLIDLSARSVINTVLLDSPESGAANPWAVAWTTDGRTLVVTHAGTHEVSLIDFPALAAKLEKLPAALPTGKAPSYTQTSNVRGDVPTDLAFLTGLRQRVKLHGNGPRALAVTGARAWVAGYFSDTLELLDLAARTVSPTPVVLGTGGTMSEVRRGEMIFNDATLCFQQWQSCASCHSYDARVDGLNWDLLNDGLGSPKNAKSLVWAHRTPPAMSTGVRTDAAVAVRAGFRHALFTVVPDAVPAAVDAYLMSLAPQPSPFLEDGKLSAAARRGQRLFQDPRIGCAICHVPPLFTDLQSHDVGTSNGHDGPGVKFDTPTLAEIWRTAPYLHDGSARTVREAIAGPDRFDQHGKTAELSDQQVDDLVAYVLSL